MRRKDREVTSPDEIAAILAASNVCRVAWQGETYPYIVPLNYGFTHENGRFTLYFHCAQEGEKLKHTRRNPRVAFEVDGAHAIRGQESACSYTMEYESVTGHGILTEVEASGREAGMQLLMRQIVPGKAFTFTPNDLAHVTVLRLDVESISGKRNRKANA